MHVTTMVQIGSWTELPLKVPQPDVGGVWVLVSTAAVSSRGVDDDQITVLYTWRRLA